MSMASEALKCCVPGQVLYSTKDGYHAGNGCYELQNLIHSSVLGLVHVFSLQDEHSSKSNIVEVRRNVEERNHILPSQGHVVTARVEQINLKFAKCSIICVEDTLLSNEFNSTLRKEDVREKEKDKVELYKFIQPGDIILARVLGYGETQTAYLLSIAEDRLGVIRARGSKGELLLPETKDSVKAASSEYRELRKVAILPNMSTKTKL